MRKGEVMEHKYIFNEGDAKFYNYEDALELVAKYEQSRELKAYLTFVKTWNREPPDPWADSALPAGIQADMVGFLQRYTNPRMYWVPGYYGAHLKQRVWRANG